MGESSMHELPSYRTILFATDGSDYAALAEDHALALARQTGARIEGVCVIDRRVATRLGALASGVLEELKRDGQLALDRLAQRARQASIDVGTHLAEGPVGPMILSEAARLGADMIVIGSHGQGTLLDILMGSVSMYVLHHSPIPVCIVRPSREKRT
jgi:nucleotide-binding universal stress UspA family protein